jgi:hypothetical protein
MVIAGNEAFMSGVVTNSNVPGPNPFVFFAVQDNGQGRNDPPDKITFLFLVPPFIDCTFFPPPIPPSFLNPIERGNIQVLP